MWFCRVLLFFVALNPTTKPLMCLCGKQEDGVAPSSSATSPEGEGDGMLKAKSEGDTPGFYYVRTYAWTPDFGQQEVVLDACSGAAAGGSPKFISISPYVSGSCFCFLLLQLLREFCTDHVPSVRAPPRVFGLFMLRHVWRRSRAACFCRPCSPSFSFAF